MPYDPIRNTYSITTFGDLIDNGYRLAVHCNGCGRSEWLDLSHYPKEQRFVRRRWRCEKCGAIGSIKLHPPVPPIRER